MPEDIPATPGWVDQELEETFAALPRTPAVLSCRDQYAACLAEMKAPPNDPGAGQDRCRAALMAGLAGAGIADDVLAALGERLEAIEDEISQRT